MSPAEETPPRDPGPPVVEWGGRRYRQWGKDNYLRGPRLTYLHREVYEAAHGTIPDGYVVHHVDFDPTNNNLDNLAAMSPTEHRALHKAHGPNGTSRPIPHGTTNGYTNRCCRCEACRDAWRVHSRRRRAERKVRAALHPEAVPHGKSGYANHGCRCAICKQAAAQPPLRRRVPVHTNRSGGMSPAARLARIRTRYRRVVFTGRMHKTALDDFASEVEAGRGDGVSLPRAAAEVGLHANTVRQKLRESKARREKRGTD